MNNYRGFSLIDLLITITIAILLGTIGIPNFTHLLQSTQSKAATRDLYTAFQQARTAAISTGKTITFCGSNDGESCEKKWTEYLLIFTDENQDKIAQAEEIILKDAFNKRGVNLITRVSLGLSYTKISSDGSAKFAGSVIYCPDNGDPRYMNRVTWNRVGRPYLGVDIDEDNLIDAPNGDPLTELCN
jgi:type IV fimbrial biogenesis protein FimT